MLAGDVWFDLIVKGDAPSRLRMNAVHFTPGARTAWHSHAVGQTLYVTEGVALTPGTRRADRHPPAGTNRHLPAQCRALARRPPRTPDDPPHDLGSARARLGPRRNHVAEHVTDKGCPAAPMCGATTRRGRADHRALRRTFSELMQAPRRVAHRGTVNAVGCALAVADECNTQRWLTHWVSKVGSRPQCGASCLS